MQFKVFTCNITHLLLYTPATLLQEAVPEVAL